MSAIRIVTALVLLALAAPLSAADRPPNILFVIADDWGPHAGAYGTKWVKTPGFDRVAREGLLFTHAYTPVAKCAPSRAALLTGRYPWLLEAAANHTPDFPAKFKTWPEALVERGWNVGCTGKGWGPGVANDADGKPRQMTGKPYNKRRLTPPTSGVAPNDYAANFADFLDAAPDDRPWCFWCGTLEPHRGYEFRSGVKKGGKRLADIDRVPAYWPDDETVRHDMLDYAYEVEQADDHLVRMLAKLERRGRLDDTLVVVTSDHGMPFPRVKGYAYHDSNRVPLAIRWPKGIKTGGRVIEDFVDFTDVAPTLLDVANVTTSAPKDAAAPQPDIRPMIGPFSGKTWRPILESDRGGRVVADRDRVVVGKERTDVGRPGDAGYPIRGIITRDWLYLRNYHPDRWPAGNPETGYLDTDGSPTKSLILERGRRDRTDRFWQLNFGRRPTHELYDLNRDPDCVNNLFGKLSDREKEADLIDALTEMLREQGDPRISGDGDVFDRYPVANEGTRNFYERYERGEKVNAGWVEPSDFERGKID